MRSASIELARRVDAIRDFVADGVGIVGVQSVRVPLADRAAPRMPPAAQTGPEPAPERPRADPMCPPELAPSPRMPNDPWTERPERVASPSIITVHADSFGTGGKCLRCGRLANPGTECVVDPQAADVAARHQATIDKAFARAAVPDPWPSVCDRVRELSRSFTEKFSALVHELEAMQRSQR